MSITAISADFSQDPRTVRITTTDDLSTITTTGYISSQESVIESLNAGPFTLEVGSLILIAYAGGEGWFTVDLVNDTFVAETNPGSLSETLQDGRVFVGSALNVATGVAMSGDIGIIADGTTAIQSGVIVNADVNAAAAIDFSKLAALPDGEILVGSAGTVPSAVAMSGDATIINTGALTIADDAVTTIKILDANVTLAKLAAGITPSHIVVYAGKEADGGGSASIAITVSGVLATDVVFAQVAASTNAVSVQKVTPTTDTITVLLSGDPGAATSISYQALRAAA